MSLRKTVLVYTKDKEVNGALFETKYGYLLFEHDGVYEIDKSTFLTSRVQYNRGFDAYCCLGLIELSFANHNGKFLVLVTGCVSVGKLFESEIYKITSVQFICINSHILFEEEYIGITELKRFLSSGSFYFSASEKSSDLKFDLTLSFQRIQSNDETDERFFWNKIPYTYLSQHGIRPEDAGKWFTPTICGHIEIKTAYAGSHKARLALISRYSAERAGTRFNVRGIDDNGCVANFVETEQLVILDETLISSYVQIRGSVPVFWEQTGIQVGAHKIQLSRGFEASCPAYDRHFSLLTNKYGNLVILNLLGSKEGEKYLSQNYQDHHKISTFHELIPFILFDYHAQCRTSSRLAGLALESLWKHEIYPSLHKLKDTNLFNNTTTQSESQQTHIKAIANENLVVVVCNDKNNSFGNNLNGILGLFYMSSVKTHYSPQTGNYTQPHSMQNVFIRTNCVDCIDRTNSTQSYIARKILAYQLFALGLNDTPIISRFEEMFRSMWTANGDKISYIYAGTNAMEFKGKFKEGALSVSRTIQSNFLDEARQLAIDLLLNPVQVNATRIEFYTAFLQYMFPIGTQWISTELRETLYYWYHEISEPRSLRCFIGTWNVNGGKILNASDTDNLCEWLTTPIYKTGCRDYNGIAKDKEDIIPDMYVVGFQEIIDLNAKNIAITNIENQVYWESQMLDLLKLKGRFVSVTSSQLVGVCIFLFVHQTLVPYIRDVSITKVKTGLGGTTGNKGAIFLKVTLGCSSLAFICAHLAAGQSQTRERNNDFTEITSKIQSSLQTCDYVFWFGDFNYRIDMPIDNVKDYVRGSKWTQLTEAEQLTNQIKNGLAFQDFCEGPLSFAPTYKYDVGSLHYDTSEKNRIPAWTDRILWRHWKDRPGFTQNQSDTKNTANGKISNGLKLLVYNRAELTSSDHRPVYGMFDMNIRILSIDLFSKCLSKLIEATGPLDRSIRIYLKIGNNSVPVSHTQKYVIGRNGDFNDSDEVLHEIYQSINSYLTSQAGDILWLRFDQNIISENDDILNAYHNGVQQHNETKTSIPLYYIYGLTCTFSKGYSAYFSLKHLCNTKLPRSPKLSNFIRQDLELVIMPCRLDWQELSQKQLYNLIKLNQYLFMGNGSTSSSLKSLLVPTKHPSIANSLDLENSHAQKYDPEYLSSKIENMLDLHPEYGEVIDADIDHNEPFESDEIGHVEDATHTQQDFSSRNIQPEAMKQMFVRKFSSSSLLNNSTNLLNTNNNSNNPKNGSLINGANRNKYQSFQDFTGQELSADNNCNENTETYDDDGIQKSSMFNKIAAKTTNALQKAASVSKLQKTFSTEKKSLDINPMKEIIVKKSQSSQLQQSSNNVGALPNLPPKRPPPPKLNSGIDLQTNTKPNNARSTFDPWNDNSGQNFTTSHSIEPSTVLIDIDDQPPTNNTFRSSRIPSTNQQEQHTTNDHHIYNYNSVWDNDSVLRQDNWHASNLNPNDSIKTQYPTDPVGAYFHNVTESINHMDNKDVFPMITNSQSWTAFGSCNNNNIISQQPHLVNSETHFSDPYPYTSNKYDNHLANIGYFEEKQQPNNCHELSSECPFNSFINNENDNNNNDSLPPPSHPPPALPPLPPRTKMGLPQI